MHKKKILIATDYYLPHWTGLSKALLYLTDATADEIDWTVLTMRHKNDLPPEETRPEAKVVRIKPLFKMSRTFVSPSFVTRAFREIATHDAVYINAPCTYILPLAIIAAFRRKPLIVFNQGDLILPAGLTNRLIQTVFDFSMLAACSMAKCVSTYTRDYAEHSRVLKGFMKKFTPLIPPFPAPKPAPKKVIDGIRSGLPAGKIYIGFAGRFVEEKGFDYLLDAIPDICKKNPRIHFVYAGQLKMGYEKFFEQNEDKFNAARQHITDLGLLDAAALEAFYELINFVVIPSRSDCFPLVQVEAMMHGVPSIVTDIPGARYLVKSTGFGIVCKPRSSDALCESILTAVGTRREIMRNRYKLDKIMNFKTLKRKDLEILNECS